MNKLKLMTLGLLIGAVNLVYGENVDEIVKKAYQNAYYNGSDGKAVVNMTIVDKQGKERNRKMVILRKDEEDLGKQKFYVYFKEPADVRNMVFMVYKNSPSEDDRWLYMPALDLVKRIAASDKRSSFVGSDFTYEDISGRELDVDSHEIVEEDNKFYVLKNVPKNKEKFAYYKVWIDKSNYLPVKSEYYDESDKLYRVMSAEKIDEIEGFPTVTEMKVENLETGNYTINKFEKVDYDLGIDENIFTERYLRRAPRDLIR